MKGTIRLVVPLILFLSVCVLISFWDVPLQLLETYTKGNGWVGYSAFVSLLIVATVCAPITVMPLVPMVVPIFGPFLTGVLSIVGWTLGATLAFLVARLCGRPLLERFISFEIIDGLTARLPVHARFFSIVLLRMAFPVDIISYVLGFSRTVSYVEYVLGTMVGVAWFSFAFAYLGDSIMSADMRTAGIFTVVSAVIFLTCWGILMRYYLKK